MSLFRAKRFAFAILFSFGQAYMHCSKRAAPLHHAKATRPRIGPKIENRFSVGTMRRLKVLERPLRILGCAAL
jgi:hypothetical protein